MYKAASAQEELAASQNALKILKAYAEIISYDAEWGKRAVIAAKKLEPTPKQYPRKSGAAKKQPL